MKGEVFGKTLPITAKLFVEPFRRYAINRSQITVEGNRYPDALERLNHGPGPRVFLSAVNVATNERKIFSQPQVTIDTLRASACLPAEFQAVTIDGQAYWDGGYLGNPALKPVSFR